MRSPAINNCETNASELPNAVVSPNPPTLAIRRCLALALELDTVTISSLPTRVVVVCGLISYSL